MMMDCSQVVSIGSLTHMVSTLSKKQYQEEFTKLGVSLKPEQTYVLSIVVQGGGSAPQSEFNQMTPIIGDKSQISRMIQDMVAKGILSREADTNDRRFTVLSLTEKGWKEAKLVQQALENRLAVWRANFSEEELETLSRLLNKGLTMLKSELVEK